jgi:hypothetical protein
MKHNGWANYDTWLVVVHLQNVESNYHKILEMTSSQVRLFDVDDLQQWFTFEDEIDFDQVDMDEIVENIMESRNENV